MKTDNPEGGTIYRGNEARPRRRLGLFLPLPLLLLPAALILVHFLNLFLQWTVIRQELAHGPAFRSPEYTFLGFAPFNRKEIAAVRLLPNAAPTGRVFAYFDPLHPAVFLIWNNGRGEDFFDMGPVIVAVPAGASRVSLLPGSVFSLQQGKRSAVCHFGGALVGRPWQKFLRGALVRSAKGRNGATGSFVVKEAERSRYMKIPFLIYFFAPLLVIAFMINAWGTAMAAAFFYYVEMFFLFDFQKLFVTIPLSWLFDALKIELSDLWILILSVLLTLFFLIGSIYGLRRWNETDAQPSRKWAVLFFVLLPFFLFF